MCACESESERESERKGERKGEKGGRKGERKASLPRFWEGLNLLAAGLPVAYDEY